MSDEIKDWTRYLVLIGDLGEVRLSLKDSPAIEHSHEISRELELFRARIMALLKRDPTESPYHRTQEAPAE